MNELNSFSERPNHKILLVIVMALLILFIFAMFSGKRNDDTETGFYVSNNMQKNAYVNNDWFAVEVSKINRDTASEYNISPKTKGVVIVDLDGSRNVFMKLREGDVITGINNRGIDNLKDFRNASKNINPGEGVLLDIQRDGYPMYVSINGADTVSGRPIDVQNSHQFSMTEVAPVLGRDIDVGGVNVEAGIAGKQIEKWINKNLESDFHACPKCGTLVPSNVYQNNKLISCPNCGTRMVSKR